MARFVLKKKEHFYPIDDNLIPGLLTGNAKCVRGLQPFLQSLQSGVALTGLILIKVWARNGGKQTTVTDLWPKKKMK